MHPDHPRIGVVVPVYRAEAFIAASLASVQQQTIDDWVCVVVDDGSPDESARVVAEVIADEPRMRMVRQANRGVSAARNAGLAELPSSVEVVAFLDADDVWCADALERLVTRLDADPGAVGVHGYAEYVDDAGAEVEPGLHPARQQDRRRIDGRRLRAVPIAEPLTFEEAVVISPLYPPATAVFRRSAVERAGGFDEGVAQMEDWDLYLRMMRHGHIPVLTEQVAWYRVHPGQATQRNEEALVGHDLVRRRTWRSPENTVHQRRATVRAWRQLQARRTFRAVQRLAEAARAGRRHELLPLLAGAVVVASQNLRSGPPRPSARVIRWTKRHHT